MEVQQQAAPKMPECILQETIELLVVRVEFVFESWDAGPLLVLLVGIYL